MRRILAAALALPLVWACAEKPAPSPSPIDDVRRPAAEWLREEPVRLLQDYVRIDTTPARGEQAGAEFLRRFFECEGIEAEMVCPAPGRCNVLARLPGERRENALLLLNHIDVVEDPLVRRGKGSAAFDEEGVRTRARKVVDAGRVEGYFLSSYSARKLGMKTTGNAGGSHNLTLKSRLTHEGDDLAEMLRKLGTGLFVIELMGQGVNYVTGDYSRGASGFWVEKGKIAFPVHEITIAGNLKDMLMGIEAIGADAYTFGAKTTGSVLVNRMKVAGS